MLDTAQYILDVFQDGIVISDHQGIILKSNTRYTELSAIPAYDLVGCHTVQLVEKGIFDLVLNPEIVESCLPALRVQRVSNGRRLILDGHPVLDTEGRVRFVVTFIRDAATLMGTQARMVFQHSLLHTPSVISSSPVVAAYEFQSSAMRQAYDMAYTVAASDVTMLIMGETGVGKSVLAQKIHAASPRATGPFIKVDCGSIPEGLIEAELFGYAPGAFSGGKREGHTGLFGAAHGGTLFLDEIGELPLTMQPRLLRMLQDKEVQRVGEVHGRKIDVRVVAATNKNLEELMSQGAFRRDLYYRLKVVALEMPPLRQCKRDILPLAQLFLHHFCCKFQRQMRLGSDVKRTLHGYTWPGNIRELENLMQAICVRHQLPLIRSVDLLLEGERTDAAPSFFEYDDSTYKEAMSRFEYQLLAEVLKRQGSLSLAARQLDLSRSTLFRKIKNFEAQGYHSPQHNKNPRGRK